MNISSKLRCHKINRPIIDCPSVVPKKLRVPNLIWNLELFTAAYPETGIRKIDPQTEFMASGLLNLTNVEENFFPLNSFKLTDNERSLKFCNYIFDIFPKETWNNFWLVKYVP